MRSTLNRQVFTCSEIDDFCYERIFINHDVIWLQVSMHYSVVIVQILEARQYLLHYYPDLLIFIELNLSLSAFFLYPLREA